MTVVNENTISTNQNRTLVQNGMMIASIADSFNTGRNDEMVSSRIIERKNAEK